MEKEIRIGVLISGGGTNMRAIAKACDDGEVDAEVAFVGSDNPDAKGLVWAKKKHLSTFVVDYEDIKRQVKGGKFRDMPNEGPVAAIHEKSVYVHDWYNGNKALQYSHIACKIAAEQELLKKISGFGIDLLVLAGYMQICTANLINVMNMGYDLPRIINIHPALLPSFSGVDGYGDTYRYGCKEGGATVHFVDYGEDTGPIIGQSSVKILPSDDLETFKKRGLQAEYKLYPACIELFSQNRLKVVQQKLRDGSMRKVVEILPEGA